jgi:hypothetical protein
LVRTVDGALITRAEHASSQMQIEWNDGVVTVKRD